jgi:glycosyltransferase involved in cell wall biosynthesis
MKAAVVFDELNNKGGGERAVLVLARAFNADVWTTTYRPEYLYPGYSEINVKSNPLFFLKLRLNTGFLRSINGAICQTESVLKFKHMDIEGYDLVISIGHGGKQVPLYSHQKRLHYELYVKTEYKSEWLFKPWVLYMKKIDKEMTGKISTLACNSENIRNKIRNYYQRDAQVIHPAVNINMFKIGESDDYFLSAQRVAPEKNIETQLEAFRIVSNKKLLIVGYANEKDQTYFRKLKSIAPSNVVFLGSVTDQQLVDLYAHCLAVIQTHPDEDLGRVPIEAMASGKPCIAVNAGGFKETILNGITGLLVDLPYAEKMAYAITHFKKLDFDPADCLDRAKLFSEEAHIIKMRDLVTSL